jgi:NAD(P)-dependent dehydrogenase (short-subunit alcohol dehydrogenase family)
MDRSMPMQGRVIIVTGGAGLIGKTIVRQFHEAGARVAIVDISREKIDTAYDFAGIPEADRVQVVADVAEEEAARAMVERTVDRFGRLDTVVTCAYQTTDGDATEVTLDEWNRCLAVSLTPTFLAAKYALPAIVATAETGSLTAISSIHGSFPAGSKFMYATAKAALNMLVRGLALDLTPKGLRVNGVAPGGVKDDSERFDPQQAFDEAASYLVGRFVSSEDIADAVLFLSSDRASAITGHVLPVDGGTTVPLQDWVLNDVTRRRQER